MTRSHAPGAGQIPSGPPPRCRALLAFLRALGVALDRMASLLSTALFDRLRLFRGIVVVLTRGVGLVRGVRVVLALVVFLSGAFGHRVFPFLLVG